MSVTTAPPRRTAALWLALAFCLAPTAGALAQDQHPTLAASSPPSAPPSAAASPDAAASPSASPGDSAVAAYDVTMLGREFHPLTLEVTVGTTVDWLNDDGEQHTVTALDGSFGSGLMAIGDTFAVTFATAGTFDYLCAIHPLMTGAVVVSP